jgi:hypothetical protein
MKALAGVRGVAGSMVTAWMVVAQTAGFYVAAPFIIDR